MICNLILCPKKKIYLLLSIQNMFDSIILIIEAIHNLYSLNEKEKCQLFRRSSYVNSFIHTNRLTMADVLLLKLRHLVRSKFIGVKLRLYCGLCYQNLMDSFFGRIIEENNIHHRIMFHVLEIF